MSPCRYTGCTDPASGDHLVVVEVKHLIPAVDDEDDGIRTDAVALLRLCERHHRLLTDPTNRYSIGA